MRKLLGLFVAGVALQPATASAAPRSGLHTRIDPDDTLVLDIQGVTTAQRRRTLFGISSYDVFEPTDLYDGFLEFQLDTKGDHQLDFFLQFTYNRRKNMLHCWLSNFRAQVGNRHVRYDAEGGVSCRIPTAWLDIDKEENFVVGAWLVGQNVDRAPDQGRYAGL